MQDFNDLYYFVQVVEHGGFTSAARALGIPKSKLSRRMAQLEDRLGVRLVQRSTRQFSVTEIGQEYHRQCLAMIHGAEAAQAVIDNIRSEPKGIIRLTCPPGLLSDRFGDLITGFMIANPLVDIHLKSINRKVDVIGEGYDLAIRIGLPPLEQSGLVMRKLGESRQCLVASQALLNDRPALRVPADLNGVPSVDFGIPHGEHPHGDGAHAVHIWCLLHADGLAAQVNHIPRLVSDDLGTLRSAAIGGIGIAQLPTMMVHDDIAQGRLVHVLPDWRPPSAIVHAVFPSRRGLLPSIRGLLDHLASACATDRESGAYGNA